MLNRMRIGKLYLILAMGFLLVIQITRAGQAQTPLEFDTDELSIQTQTGETYTFTVELAVSPKQHQKGLMFRRELSPDHGMLFIYDRAHTATMWMKNTLIPLDMLFIANDGKIVKIAERTIPHSRQAISAGQPVTGVLELRGGTTDRLEIDVGDIVIHDAFKTR